jgi:hypothetical protein
LHTPNSSLASSADSVRFRTSVLIQSMDDLTG